MAVPAAVTGPRSQTLSRQGFAGGSRTPASSVLPADWMADAAIGRLFKDAAMYCKEPDRRYLIFQRLLASLPERGELVIIAHSLGSVVAADLLYYLPPD